MAGRFESVIGIVGFEAFVKAVVTVLDSRGRAEATDHPIAVLVQPLIEPAFGGVLFGVDPVTGRSDRRVVSAVVGGPEPLVSGEVDGSRFVLDLSGEASAHGHVTAGRRSRGACCDGCRICSARSRTCSASPQDVEWAIGTDDALWLLQSRPVTTAILGVPSRTDLRPRSHRRDVPGTARPSWSTTSGFLRSVTQCARRSCSAGSATAADVAASDVVVACAATSRSICCSLVRSGPKGAAAPAEPGPGQPAAARCVAHRSAPFRAAQVGRASLGPCRCRPRVGARAVAADQPTADRAAASHPGRAAGAARPRDPDGDAGEHRREPDDRGVGGAAGAGRGPPRRARPMPRSSSAARSCWP